MNLVKAICRLKKLFLLINFIFMSEILLTVTTFFTLLNIRVLKIIFEFFIHHNIWVIKFIFLLFLFILLNVMINMKIRTFHRNIKLAQWHLKIIVFFWVTIITYYTLESIDCLIILWPLFYSIVDFINKKTQNTFEIFKLLLLTITLVNLIL